MIKAILILLGTLSLGLGITGIFIPGLPTTPFILLTAGLYLRSSEKLYRQLIQNKYLGRYIVEFGTDKGMTIKLKLYSITLMWIMISMSVYFIITSTIIDWLVISLGLAGTVVMGIVIPTNKEKSPPD